MSPEIWGKTAWNFIHYVTLGYPEKPTQEEKIKYYNYFNALQYVLPCRKCRNNMSKHLTTCPLTDYALENRSNLVKWGIDLHNVVNKSIGKPVLSYEQALSDLNRLREGKSNAKYGWWYAIIIILIIIILFVIVIIRSKC